MTKHIPYSKFDKRKKKKLPCSFEGCELLFDDPGLLLAHEDEHESGDIVTASENIVTKTDKPKDRVRSKGIPYANETEGEEREVIVPEDKIEDLG